MTLVIPITASQYPRSTVLHISITNYVILQQRRCETCGKGFLRRERYVTHVRIHTGEKPFVCAVCARGYRDTRELRKHQASHNHTGQAAPIPGNPQAIAAVNAAQAAAQTQHTTASTSTLAATAAVTGPPTAASVAAAGGAAALPALPAAILNADASPGGTKTIIVQQTVSLPSQPLPKEVLNMNGNANQVQIIQQPAPLNPATIPLPPSVATALQSINEKVAARQAKQAKQAIQNLATQPAPPPPQTITIAKQEAPQVVAIPQAAVAAAGTSSNGSPLFYYVMPSNAQYSIASDGGSNTVRVTTEGGNVSTAQLVSVPASAIQAIQGGHVQGGVQVVAGGGTPIQTNGGTVSTGATTAATTSYPASWIIETTSPTGAASRGGGSGANAM